MIVFCWKMIFRTKIKNNVFKDNNDDLVFPKQNQQKKGKGYLRYEAQRITITMFDWSMFHINVIQFLLMLLYNCWYMKSKGRQKIQNKQICWLRTTINVCFGFVAFKWIGIKDILQFWIKFSFKCIYLSIQKLLFKFNWQ